MNPNSKTQTNPAVVGGHSMAQRLPRLILTLGVALCARSPAVQAQAWQTVDLYQPRPGIYANATDIGTGADGTTLYSVGSSYLTNGGDYSATIRRSADSGVTWTTVDDYLEPGWSSAGYRGIGAGADGTLFAAGALWEGLPNTGTKTWIVRQSNDGGTTWGTVDAFYQGLTAKPTCGDIKVNPYTGDVFAVGAGNSGSTSGFYWTVRRRAANAQAFTTVDYTGAAPINEARAIGFHPTVGTFVVGRMGDGSRDVWTVRRSLDGGETWTTVDSFQDSAKTYSEARGIAVSPSGAIYVCGRAAQVIKGKTLNNWVVRRSLNGGMTWTTVDRFGAEPTPFGYGVAAAVGITVAPSGAVFISGVTPAPSRHVVRKGTTAANGTMKWVTSDDYQLVPGLESFSQGITSDAYGNIFSAGKGVVDGTGLSYFLVRRLAGPQ